MTEFLKPVSQTVTMTNGHCRVFFKDRTTLELMVGKRGPVFPLRKRAGQEQLVRSGEE